MFLPPWFYIVLTVFWIAVGAPIGAMVGYYSAKSLRLTQRPWIDATAGALGVALLFVLVLLLARVTTEYNGRTLGPAGIVLDHLIVWGLFMISVTVVGAQLYRAHMERKRANNSLPSHA